MGDVEEALRLPCGTATVVLRPLLTFESTSRDGFWPGFSQADALQGPPPLLGAARRAALTHSPSSIEAVTCVPQEVASHLNRFTDLELEGVTAPAIRFGGMSRTFAFEPFDYPHGRPAHFAFFSGARLVVARGSDAEKGPFVHLAEGEPSQGPLSFDLFDGPSALCTFTFLDFVTQADTMTESPTAGEGVAPNVIQFGLGGRPPRPFVHLSLAETGVGAGLETIRHAAGTYRNRVLLSAP